MGTDDIFCVGCGARLEELSLPPRSGDTPGATRAELRLTAMTSGAAPAVGHCAGCKGTLGPDEQFCSHCGRGRDAIGFEEVGFTALEAKSQAAWKEVEERLKAATAGRYEIVHELGRGGMATVYLAREIALKREVAIKVMRPNFLLDPTMVDRFLREARTMAALRHPNIVTIYSVEEVNQLYFFVMQFVPGRSLDRVIDGKQLPVAATQAVLYEAASALSHAHRQGVIHRDIKPANILLDQSGCAIVTDFGIAKVKDVQSTSATVGMMGTPLYMSPEQCEAKPVTPLSDMYSLGNVAYEMLTGVPPFQRATAFALGTAIVHEKPKPIRAFRDDCPPAVEDAVLRMLAKNPADRFPTLTEAMAALGGEALAEDDPIREFLKILAQRDDRPSGRHLTPRPSKTGPRWGRTGWTGFEGDTIRRAIAAVITVGTLSPLLYLGGRKLLDRRGEVTPVVDSARSGAGGAVPTPVDSSALLPPPPPPPAPQPASTPPAKTPARVQQLLGTVRRLVQRADWRRASDSVAALLALDPSNIEGKRLAGRVATALAASEPVPPPPPQPVPPPVPAPVRPTADTATPRPPVRSFDAAPVLRLIDRYVAALNARDIGRLKAVYPGLTAKQESDWRDRFSKEIKRLSATATSRRVEESVSGATVSFVIDLILEPDGAPPISYRIRSEAVAQQAGGEWVLVSLTERGAEGDR